MVFFFKWEGKAGAAKENAGLQVIWASCYVDSNVFICMRYLTYPRTLWLNQNDSIIYWKIRANTLTINFHLKLNTLNAT